MRKPFKPISASATISVGAVLLVIILIKLWLGPVITKKQCRSALLSVWKGTIEIEDVDFNLIAPVFIKGLKLTDDKGNCRLFIHKIKATLTDRWTGRPRLSELEIEQLELKSHFTDEVNDIALYIRKKPKTEKSASMSLQKLDIKSISVTTDINSVPDTISGKANLSARRKPETNVFEGLFVCENIDLAKLSHALQTGEKFEKGKISANYAFTVTGIDTSNMQGKGLIVIDDADLITIPLIKSLFNTIGLAEFDLLTMSDSLVLFSNSGPVVTIEKARICNPLAAIRLEPGGRVDVSSGLVDFYAIASPLTDIEELIAKVPFMNLFVELKDKLIRLHVKGKWDQAPIITKEPLEDIKEATIEFFSGAVKSSGQITTDTIDAVKGIFNGNVR